MRIIYGYSNCSDDKYRKIVNENHVSVLQPDQKYHGLLIKGLSKNGANVQCLSGLPINRAVTSKVWIHEKDETEGNIRYHYYKTLNLPVIRQLMIFCGAFINCLKIIKTADTFAICDCLNIANAYGMAFACRLRKIPIVTIVTDLPDMMSDSTALKGFNNRVFHNMDGFVFLTEAMNQRLNVKKKPYIVLEGHVDSDAAVTEHRQSFEEKTGKKVIIYAGSVQRLYGIQNLTEGFLKSQIPNAELWIYGDGDYKDELIEIAKTNSTVIYKGVRENREIVEAERMASLLVNPRPIAPEYTKYSFPSKNMEYMVSGTPVLTTKLPGMPAEYGEYVYLLEDESPDGVSKTLKNILNIPFEQRKEKGEKAKEFVLEHKSNVIQSKRILSFLQNILK